MIYWTKYEGHEPKLIRGRKLYDNTIYTFDIETTSYIIYKGKQFDVNYYLELSEKQRKECLFQSTMYIWMFGIDNMVYYGRTWEEFENFLEKINTLSTNKKKTCFIHNASFEFEFLRNQFVLSKVFARKSRHVIRFEIEKYNFEFRCSYMMSNCALEKLSSVFGLDTKKLVGNLDYAKIRNNKTKLTTKELSYCENDCLVVYEFIKKELETYETVKKIPLTSTGHVRLEFKQKIEKSWKYKNKVRKAISEDPHVYMLLLKAFAGGYTHANWTKADEVIKDVTSFDFCSSYPYCMVSEKYPSSEFRKTKAVKKYEDMRDCFCYIVRVKFKNIKSKYFNNFISESKVEYLVKGRYDNGRIISAEELEIVVTNVDLKIIFETYKFEYYSFEEVYYSFKDYLPKEFIDFILEKYKLKTEYKNVPRKRNCL